MCSRHNEAEDQVTDGDAPALLGVGLNHHGMTLENIRLQAFQEHKSIEWKDSFDQVNLNRE